MYGAGHVREVHLLGRHIQAYTREEGVPTIAGRPVCASLWAQNRENRSRKASLWAQNRGRTGAEGPRYGSRTGENGSRKASLWAQNREKQEEKGLVMGPEQGERGEKGLVVPLFSSPTVKRVLKRPFL